MLTIDEIEALEVMCALAYDSKIKNHERGENTFEEREQQINDYKIACAALARIKEQAKKF